MSETVWLWTAKAGGAVAGSAISLAYVLPAGRREAAIRFGVGVASGLVFGGTAGLKVAVDLLKRAMLVLVAHWYEFRAAFSAKEQPVSFPAGYARLIAPWRVRRL